MTNQISAQPAELIFIQSRANTNYDVIDEYAAMMRDGVQFDAAQGVRDESGQIFVYDGLHRGEAAKLADRPLLVEVRPGTRTEAEWLALTANQKHGLRRSRADKRRVVRQALRHAYGVNLSNREIARHCGVDDKTVGRIRQEMETTAEIPQLETRMVRKADGTRYEINTTNIGARPSQAAERLEERSLSLSPRPSQSIPSENGPADHGSTPSYQPKPQEFECPQCGREKIVGINGSRRWCLACGAEWSTPAALLAAIERPQPAGVSRTQLQRRFEALLAQADESQLNQLAGWLEQVARSMDQEAVEDSVTNRATSLSLAA